MGVAEQSASSLEDIASIDWWKRFPDIKSGNIAAGPYYSEEYFQMEKEVFRRQWLQVARVEEIPHANDYIVVDLGFVGGATIVVSRGTDGRLHAVYNTCSHRGNQVAWEPRGNTDALTCGYHGWRYTTSGAVDFIPDEESFTQLDRGCLGLTPVHVDEWSGFIFVNLMHEPEQSLRDFIGPELVDSLAGYPFEEMSATSYWWTTDVNANWKFVRDPLIETYHVRNIHKKSTPNVTWGPQNPYSHCTDFELFERHCTLGVPGSPAAVVSFMMGMSGKQPPWFPSFDLPPGLNRKRSQHWLQDVEMIFPNFVLNSSPGAYYTYNVWPLAVDRTRISERLYFAKPKTAGQRAAQEYFKVLQRDASMEDNLVVEQQHRAAASGAKKEFCLQAQEVLILHQTAVLDREINRILNGSVR